jgi:hypothetical protein
VYFICDLAPQGSWDRFITLTDVSQLLWAINKEKIWLYPEDAILTRLWIDHLKSDNVNAFYKDKLDQPPSGSRLQPNVFILCMQMRF